jgi:hypothetical protein
MRVVIHDGEQQLPYHLLLRRYHLLHHAASWRQEVGGPWCYHFLVVMVVVVVASVAAAMGAVSGLSPWVDRRD